MTGEVSTLVAPLGHSAQGAGIGPSLSRREILGDDVLLTVNEVASLIGVSVRQVYAMIHRRTFPFPKKIGALSRWRLGTIRTWINTSPQRV